MIKSKVKINAFSNYLGSILIAIISFAAIPFYIDFMGVEAYGLVGFFAAMQTTLAVIDMGMTTTISREIAKLSTLSTNIIKLENIVKTFGVIYWIEALVLGVLVIILAPLISIKWLTPDILGVETVTYVVISMGFAIAAQWPCGLYSGGLIGLQRQVYLNIINILTATLRSGGALLILWLVSPTIKAFFVWQVLINAFQTFVTALVFYLSMPRKKGNGRFDIDQLREIWSFSAALGGSTILSVIISQADKLILSKILTLEMFGYYSLVAVVSTSISRFIGPLVIALFPRFTELIAVGDIDKLKQSYHSGCQAMSVIIIPIALFIAFFGKEIIFLWTRNPSIVENTYILVFFMTISTMLAGLSHLPLTLLYAKGKSIPILYINIIMAAVGIPTIWFAALTFGAIGVVIVLLGLSFLYLNGVVQIIHKYILVNEKKQWYLKDLGIPFFVALSVILMLRMLVYTSTNQWYTLILIVFAFCITILITALSAPDVRKWLFENRQVKQLFNYH